MGVDKRSDAIRKGMERARANGRKPGRPNAGEDAWPLIERMVKQGCSIDDVAIATGLSPSTVRRVLRRHDS